jgi:hypothetical protein
MLAIKIVLVLAIGVLIISISFAWAKRSRRQKKILNSKESSNTDTNSDEYFYREYKYKSGGDLRPKKEVSDFKRFEKSTIESVKRAKKNLHPVYNKNVGRDEKGRFCERKKSK